MRKKRKSCCLPGNLGWNFRTSFWPRFRPRFGTARKTRNFFCDKGQKGVAPSESWWPECQSKKLPEIYVEILEMIYEKFFVINHGHRHGPRTDRPGLPGSPAPQLVAQRSWAANKELVERSWRRPDKKVSIFSPHAWWFETTTSIRSTTWLQHRCHYKWPYKWISGDTSPYL